MVGNDLAFDIKAVASPNPGSDSDRAYRSGQADHLIPLGKPITFRLHPSSGDTSKATNERGAANGTVRAKRIRLNSPRASPPVR